MRFLNKLNSLLIVFSLVCSVFLPTSTWASSSNLSSIDYQARKEFIQTIGMSQSIVENENDTVTRAEFLYAIALAFNQPLAESGDTGFSDVDQSHPYIGGILLGLDRNIIYKADQFEPDRPITLNQAIKMTLCAVGFQERSELRGGYPLGYLQSAVETDLLRNVTNDESVSIADAYNLLYNMLNINIMTRSLVSNSAITFTQSDKTLLGLYFDIYKVVGQVTATHLTGLFSLNSAAVEDKITIDDQAYFCYLRDTYLGYTVTAYYKLENDSKEIIFMAPNTSNSVMKISGQDVLDYDNFKLNYLVGARESSVNLSRDYGVIYNGKSYSDYTAADFKPNSGYVLLLDTNSDSIYDIVFIQSYETMVIKSIDVLGSAIFDANGQGSIHPNEPKEMVYHIDLLTEDGYTPGTLLDLTEGMVVNFAVSKDGYFVDLYQLDSIVGVLEANSEEGVYIDGQVYETSNYFNKYFNNIRTGAGTSFYVSREGLVCAADRLDEDIYRYGYLIRMIKNSSVDSVVKVAMLTTRNVVSEMILAQRITLNGEGANSSTDVYNFFVNSEHTNQQIVKYRLDQDGLITGMYTESQDEDTAVPFTRIGDPDAIVRYFTGMRRYRNTGSILCDLFTVPSAGGSIRISTATAIFNVPSPENRNYDHKAFAALVPSDFSNTEILNNAVIYDVDRTGWAGAVVNLGVEGFTRAVTVDSQSAIIERVSTALNYEGTPATKLSYWSNGTYTSSFLREDTTFVPSSIGPSNITPGDVVRLAIDENDEIRLLHEDFNYGTKDISEDQKNMNEDAQAKIRFGLVYSYDGANIYMSTRRFSSDPVEYAIDFNSLHLYPVGSAHMVVFDSSTNTVKPARSSDITDYMSAGFNASEILIRQRNYTSNLIVVYK